MENGYDGGVADKFSTLSVAQQNQQQERPDSSLNDSNNSDNDSLFQVMKAVEAAETTIKQQVEENCRLRAELEGKIQEIDRYRLNELFDQQSQSTERWSEPRNGPFETHSSVLLADNQEGSAKNAINSFVANPEDMLVTHRTLEYSANAARNTPRKHSESDITNESLRSAFSSLPTTSNPASRYHLEGENDLRFNMSGQVLVPMAEVNNSNFLAKEDPTAQIQERQEEITQLRRHLSEYSIKEAQIQNEKYILEKRVAYMHLAFDQQQQDLVDAASKALSYRQDIIEENIRLTYALQDVQQERSNFVSSLLPLLSEYSLQPPAHDAQSIVNNVKVLFKHLQEKLLLTESKLKKMQYQLGPQRTDLNNSSFTPQSPPHPFDGKVAASKKNELEIIPQTSYTQGKTTLPTDGPVASDWDAFGHHKGGVVSVVSKNLDADSLEKYSAPASRKAGSNDIPSQVAASRDNVHATLHSEVTNSKQVPICEPGINSELHDLDGEGNQGGREHASNWSAGNSSSTTTVDDTSPSYSPYLPPVLEEPSSFSEAADDDPLPAIDEIQISGEAFPGRALQACGYSINGTTSCNFEWVRHLEDGSVNYIEGAKQPNYLITADDVDTYLAIEVQPLDNRNRKGELVKVFANDHKKITCDPEMHSEIEKTLYAGHASYRVSLSTGYLDIWEPAILAIKREGYSIKCSGPSGVVVTEKFSLNSSVFIPFGLASEFVIVSSSNDEYLLRTDGSSNEVSCFRDTIVLTLRLFILRAGEKKKKKGGLFFHK